MLERVSLPVLCAGLLLLSGCGGPTAAVSSSPTAPVETVQAAPVPSTPSTPSNPTPTPISMQTPSPTPMPTPAPEETSAVVETALPMESPASEGSWTALGTASTFGRPSGTGGSLVVSQVLAGEDGLTVTLAPLPDEASVNAFQEAAGEEALPAGAVDYWSDAGALVLKLENVVLSSGDIGGDDWLHDFLRDAGLEYPMTTPTGAIPGTCPLFEKAAISSDGTNTTISLLPGETVTDYRVTALGVDGLEVSFLLTFQ